MDPAVRAEKKRKTCLKLQDNIRKLNTQKKFKQRYLIVIQKKAALAARLDSVAKNNEEVSETARAGKHYTTKFQSQLNANQSDNRKFRKFRVKGNCIKYMTAKNDKEASETAHATDQ